MEKIGAAEELAPPETAMRWLCGACVAVLVLALPWTIAGLAAAVVAVSAPAEPTAWHWWTLPWAAVALGAGAWAVWDWGSG